MTKMTKTKKFIIGTLFSVVTLGGLVAVAGPGGYGKFGAMNAEKAERIVKRVSSKLDLNELQKQNLVSLKDTMLKLKAKHKPQTDRKAFVQSLLAQPVLDETAILAKIQERSNKINEVSPQIVTALANFTNSLSDEQRAQMSKMAEKFGKRGGKH